MDVLLNWLTQGVIVAVAAAAGLRIIPPSRAQARYGFAWAAYLLVLALPTVPFALAAVGSAVPPVDLAPISAGPVTMPAVSWTSSIVASGLWIIWSSVHALQFAAGAAALRNAKRHCQECPRDVLSGLPHWSHVNTTGRPTRVVLSDRVRFAAVLGCGSPIIALAPGLLAQLSVTDLDRVLVHEWAHVQRRDDVAQLVQRLVRAIVGWHPAAWWLERQLEFEREAACDEAAVRVTGSAKGYAACLATLAALPHAPVRWLPGLAAVSPSRLRRRLMRILAARCITVPRPWRAVAICGAVGLAALAVAVSNVRVVASKAKWTSRSTATPAPRATSVAALAAVAREVESPMPHSSSTSPRRLSSSATMQPVLRERARSRLGGKLPAIEGSPKPAQHSELLPTLAWPAGTELLIPLARSTPDVPVSAGLPVLTADTPQAADEARAPWAAAAEAGVAIGRTSQSAGVATAGFFSRVGKTIARSF